MPPLFDHERLKVYQQALQFVCWAGALIENLPAKIAAKDQLDRASTSIVLNIAEGNGKRSHADRCRFFDMARGSGLECAACLDVLVVRGKITPQEADQGKAVLFEVVRMISGLLAYFSKDKSSPVAEDRDPYSSDLVEKEKD